MPIAKIQTPDGKIVSIEVPEGATEQDILNFVQSQDLSSFASAKSPVENKPEQSEAIQDEKPLLTRFLEDSAGQLLWLVILLALLLVV